MKCGEEIGRDLMHCHIVSMLQEIVEEVYQTDVVARLQTLRDTEAKVKVIRCRKLLRHWKRLYL